MPKQAKEFLFKISGGHPGYMRALTRIYFDNKDVSIIDLTKENIRALATNPTVLGRSEKFWLKLISPYREFLIEFVQHPNIKSSHQAKFLQDTGVIDDDNKIFSPLLEHFIESKIGTKTQNGVPVSNGIYIDPKTKTVYVDGKPLKSETTPNEYKILHLLYKNKKKIVTREELANILWGENAIEKYSDWAIDRTVSRIRKKIGDSVQEPRFIETIKGRGLRLIS